MILVSALHLEERQQDTRKQPLKLIKLGLSLLSP